MRRVWTNDLVMLHDDEVTRVRSFAGTYEAMQAQVLLRYPDAHYGNSAGHGYWWADAAYESVVAECWPHRFARKQEAYRNLWCWRIAKAPKRRHL